MLTPKICIQCDSLIVEGLEIGQHKFFTYLSCT